MKYSKWFRERYRPEVKLFLDEDDTRHYDSLSSNTLPFGFKGQNKTVLNQMLLHENFTNPSIHKKKAGSKTGCVRCAVVGCGGILNGSGAGDEIDSHDYVFRVNRALTKERFANDVGKRTTFYTFFPESQNIKDVEDKNVLLFFTMFKTYDVEYGLNMIKDVPPPPYISRGKVHPIRKPASDPRRLKIVHPDFFKYVFHTYLDDKSARPTTGALVVGLALHVCDEVTIYGFGYDPRFTMHYYDTKFVTHTQASTGSHDVDNERMLWMKLHDEGVIRLFKRDV
ncbi:alpha-N-acetylgalactosaminide alpha-2,6-sialyltransferase 1-like [Asterias rubens]|uniref:alpha-N-acetylgalactosaminide alpha-2,6-sialyltransferase 1-like n=1 Tax=Asterias rubens TaxID=7604 RepID=UPI001454E525|nr:alpha-N-acetylgalactosaminide alpha-2,6-sialyltransferase 1-like [Asterias rubens]